MMIRGHKPLFWGAIIAQVVGAQVFFWDALPDYGVDCRSCRGGYAQGLFPATELRIRIPACHLNKERRTARTKFAAM
jgi:hypothetical protein